MHKRQCCWPWLNPDSPTGSISRSAIPGGASGAGERRSQFLRQLVDFALSVMRCKKRQLARTQAQVSSALIGGIPEQPVANHREAGLGEVAPYLMLASGLDHDFQQ